MKKVSIVAFKRKTAETYGETLKTLFLNNIIVESYSIEEDNITDMNSDIIIASTYSIYDLIKKKVKNCSNIIIANITLTKSSLKKLTNLPLGTKGLLVNSSLEMSVETIETIYNSGLDHLNLYPVYPGKDDIPNINLAITPGEVDIVPDFVEEIIDIGDRVLSMRTIVNIAMKLNLSHMVQSSRFKKYFLGLVKDDLGFEELFGQVNILEKKLDLILKIFDDGVLVIGKDNKVHFINESAKKILNLDSSRESNEMIEEIFWKFICNEDIDNVQGIKDKVISINGQHVVVSIYPVINIFDDSGYIVLIRLFTDTEREQNKIRKQIISRGHIAKYSFDHIIGESVAIRDAKEKARKFSMSNSSVLIYGKSGTGKELFAQSIHNSSSRKENPFIAVNCASIPESLLESELFGYEPGAFTGAKKAGKMGYFELAHTGTLFLDEISELDFALQARLLRVLQEKEVVRIGGESVINVDVRIISATNQDLRRLVRENRFREDLYYRINVLRVNLPQLKDRRGDIKLLVENFKNQLNTDFEIKEKDMHILENYNWPGNIRELRNCVERLKCLGKRKISAEDLYQCLDIDDNYYYKDISSHCREEDIIIGSFIEDKSEELNKYYNILTVLKEAYKKGERLGRRSISEILMDRHIYITEQEVRTVLEELRLYKIVEIYRGRGGTKLTELGYRTCKYMDRNKMY